MRWYISVGAVLVAGAVAGSDVASVAAPEATQAPKLQAVSPDTVAPASKSSGRTREDKDHPLFQDIRYLGRLLGDVLREQEGDAVFDVVQAAERTGAVEHSGVGDDGCAARRPTYHNAQAVTAAYGKFD